jgi:aldehyde dehydrogenase (NAD+)
MQAIQAQPTAARAATRSSQDETVHAIPELVASARRAFATGKTRGYEWRIAQLEAIGRFVSDCEAEISDALAKDVGKPQLEGYMTEIAYTLGDVDLARKSLKKWMRPERVSTPIFVQPGKSRIHKEPYGVVLVIAPWNYPFGLVMSPLIGAIAAGNCVVVKPSEVAPHTSALLARKLPHYVDRDCIRVVEGAVPETTALLAEKWDYIFYTGNGAVGRVVMQAAAKHLTPVTLELGGKSPCIVDEHVNLDTTVKRILWGKFSNAGQTCVAPDYILAHERIHDALLDKLKATIQAFYGDDPQKSPDYGRVVNARHHARLMKLMQSGEVAVGGQADAADRYIAPTVLKNVAPDSPVMGEEIFGPLLPVLKVKSIDDAIAFVNGRDKPLALYVFTTDAAVQEQVLAATSSGGATVNHCWVHLAVPDLPFGGVGESGMGAYHGKGTFETFSHKKSVLKKPFLMDPPVMYPPYTEQKRKLIKKFL